MQNGIESDRILTRYPDYMDTRTFQFFEVKQAYKTVDKELHIVFQREQLDEFQKINPVIIVTVPNDPDPILVTLLSDIIEKNEIIIGKRGENVTVAICENTISDAPHLIKEMMQEE